MFNIFLIKVVISVISVINLVMEIFIVRTRSYYVIVEVVSCKIKRGGNQLIQLVLVVSSDVQILVAGKFSFRNFDSSAKLFRTFYSKGHELFTASDLCFFQRLYFTVFTPVACALLLDSLVSTVCSPTVPLRLSCLLHRAIVSHR